MKFLTAAVSYLLTPQDKLAAFQRVLILDRCRGRLYIAVTVIVFVTSLSVFAAALTSTTGIPGPTGSGFFGENVKVLPNGNFVVVDSGFDGLVGDAGAVYLYNGKTLEIISRLAGNNNQDRVGSGGVTVLPSGNFLVQSPNWFQGRGAATFCSMETGCDGVISAANSLVGSSIGDNIGLLETVILPNGNYVLPNIRWSSGLGAVTFGSGNTGISGVVSAANSVVGVTSRDGIGENGIILLSTDAYLIVSAAWSDNRGAVTFCNGSTGCTGTLSQANSLVGTAAGNRVGSRGIDLLANGNYVVRSASWDNGAVSNVGAVTFGSKFTGIIGEVSAANSVIGTVSGENLGNDVALLANGNYVVYSSPANGGKGGARLGAGSGGTVGPITLENSLAGHSVGAYNLAVVTPLTNGNYVVSTPSDDGPDWGGAVTFCNGATGCIGTISETISLLNASSYGHTDPVTSLSNGNYVIKTHAGSKATFANGTTGVAGRVNEANSLVGGNSSGVDFEIYALPNGNYVVCNPSWNGSRGAVTFGNGATGISGQVSAANSLVGTNNNDALGYAGIAALPNGNFVIRNTHWNQGRGAATFANGLTGITGEVNTSNSLVGSAPGSNEFTGNNITVLSNGNYVVTVPEWNGVRGSVTWGDSQTGVSGEITSANSLIGTNPNDRVGGGNNTLGGFALPNGDFVASSPNWNSDRGAATYVNGWTGITGHVTPQNSLIGSTPLDLIGNGYLIGVPPKKGVVPFDLNRYAVYSPSFDNGTAVNAGALSFGSRWAPLVGEISGTNSVRATVSGGGVAINLAIDRLNKKAIVGQPADNRVTVYLYGPDPVDFDYDGDGLSDLSVRRPSDNVWHLLRASAGYTAMQFGETGDRMAPADYDGDGRTDVAVFRPSNGTWYIYMSQSQTFQTFGWGENGDLPVPTDRDNDGRTDLVVYRESNNTWYTRFANGTFGQSVFGVAGDKPVVGDFDGDGIGDIALFRPSNNNWYIIKSSLGFFIQTWGEPGDLPLTGDFDGDGATDQAVFRPSTGQWYLSQTTAGFSVRNWGQNDDIPVAADYDGDGRTDVAVFRPSNGTWYIVNSTAGILVQQFGETGDIPTQSAFNY